MKGKGLKLTGRMIIVFMITALIAGIPAVICLNRLRTISETYNEVLKYDGFAQGYIDKVVANLSVIDSLSHDMVSFEQEEDVKNATELRNIELESYETNIKEVEDHLGDEESEVLFEEAKEKMDAYFVKADKVIEYGLTNDISDLYNYAEVEKMLTKELNPLYDEAYAAWNELFEYKEKKGNEMSAKLIKDNNSTYGGVVIATFISILIAVIFGFFCAKTVIDVLKSGIKRLRQLVNGDLKSDVPTRKVDDELKELLDAIRDLRHTFGEIIEDQDYVLGKMAEGDFTAHTRKDENYVGDFGNLLVSLRNIRGKLSDSLGEIDEAAEQVGVGSQQVASGAQELAQGATEQASAVEQLNATIDGIAKQIKENADKAIDTRKLAKSTESEIEEGNRQMQEMTCAMAEISDTSNKIAKIIKTIDDIAFQTNILALNAAVEAARAGSAGKGFAVVADEVRNLAGKSAEAAKNTTELIESSIKAVGNGTEIADRTAATLNNVVLSAQKSAEIVDEMAHSSEEQAMSIEEITKGIEQISAVVQTNSATSEESAAASEELSCQADKMRNMIAKFKIKRNTKDNQRLTYETTLNTKSDVSDFSKVKDIKLDDFDLDLGGKY